MEYVCVARVGGKTPPGKGAYTHFLDTEGGIAADLNVIRLEDDRYRVVCRGDTGHRDYIWMLHMAEERGWQVRIDDRSDEIATLGLRGMPARPCKRSRTDPTPQP